MAEENPEEFSSWCPGSGGGQSWWDWTGEVQHLECTGPDLDNSSEPFGTVHMRSAPTCLVVQSPWSLQAKFQGGSEPAKLRISRQVLNRVKTPSLRNLSCCSRCFTTDNFTKFLILSKNGYFTVRLTVRVDLPFPPPCGQLFIHFLVCPKNRCVLVQKHCLSPFEWVKIWLAWPSFTTPLIFISKVWGGKVGIFCLGACEVARSQQGRLAWIVQPGLLSALNQAWPAI